MQRKVVQGQDLDSTCATGQRLSNTTFKIVFLHNPILPSSCA